MNEEPQPHRRAQIRPLKESVEDDILSRPGVVGVDIGEKITAGEPTGQLGIIVYVREKKSEDHLSAEEIIPRAVDEVKTDVQELVVELQVAMERVGAAVRKVQAPATLTGGISMGPSRSVHLAPPDVEAEGDYTFVGTLGAMATDRTSGAPVALTNFHVACIDDGWSVGDRMVQPGIPDGGDPAIQEFGSLTRASLSESTDGAVILLDDGRPWLPRVEGIGDVTGVAGVGVGTAVQKQGRTTGLTFGAVGSVDATLSIDYGDGIGVRTLRRQIRVDTDTSRSERFSAQGDSGSAVMDLDGHVVGLLFGGSTDGSTTFANRIEVALHELDVDLATR